MNESMPPEMSPSSDEENRLEAGVVGSTAPHAEERIYSQASPPGDRKHDELIAVVVALLGVGSILWFSLGRSNPLMAKFPFQLPGMDGNGAVDGQVGAKTGQLPNANLNAGEPDAALNGAVTKPEVKNNDANLGVTVPGVPGVTAPNAVTNPPVVSSKSKPEPEKVAATAPDQPALPVPPEPPAGSVQPDSSKIGQDTGVLPSPTAPKQFKDVPETAAIAPYVAAMSSRGLIDGLGEGTFQPDKPITRAEFAGILRKAFEMPRSKPALSFTDVKSDATNAPAVAEATQTGFMNGFPDKTFKPDLQIPRYQMQVALATGLGLTPQGDPVQALSKFGDAKELPKWSLPKVSAAVNAGIIDSKAAKDLKPTAPATRGDAVVMIHEALVRSGKLPAVK
jgi:hypothetical protein